MLQSAAQVGRAVGQELENSVGQDVGHPEVPETEARVFEGAGVQVATAEPVVAAVEPEPEPEAESEPEELLVLSRGLTWLPPLALE
jgi:hypothetical protein